MPDTVPPQINDLRASDNLKRIDDLEIFRKGFEGKSFDAKVCEAIKDSVSLQNEIKALIWGVVREKIFWIIGTIAVLLFTSFLTALVGRLTEKI